MADKKLKFHAVNEAAVTQFNKALSDEAGQYPGHGTPFSYIASYDDFQKVPPTDTKPQEYFLIDELGHWEFPKPQYIVGIDPYKEDGKGSVAFWSNIPIKPKESDGN